MAEGCVAEGGEKSETCTVRWLGPLQSVSKCSSVACGFAERNELCEA